MEHSTFGTVGEGTFHPYPGPTGTVDNTFGRDISSDAEYIIGTRLLQRDEFGFYDIVDISNFDYSQVGDEQPTWWGIELDQSGEYWLAGEYFDLNTFTSRAGFWDISGNFLGSLGNSFSEFRGFAEVEGEIVAAVNVQSDTGETEGFLLRVRDMQAVSVESLIGRPGYFSGGGISDDLFSKDDALTLILEDTNGQFVTTIRTFDTAQTFEDAVYDFNPATGRWMIGRTVDGMFTQENGPRWSTAVEWETMTGDVNGDRMTDLIGRQVSTGQWWVGVAQQDGSFITSYFGSWVPGHTYVDVTVGDFNNDGSDDVAGRRTTGEWFVGLSNGSRFVTSYAGRWSADGWQEVLPGDFNGDGMQDFAGFHEGGQWWFSLYNGTSFNTSYAGRWSPDGWQAIVAGDFDGDNLTDLAGLRSDGYWWQGTSNGSKIATTYKGRWTNFSDAQELIVGDFDGDGRDDVAGLSVDHLWYTNALRDIDNTRFPKEMWGDWNFGSDWQTQLGDFNRDGMTDIAGYLMGTGQWYVLTSTGTNFDNQLYAAWPPL